MPNSLGNHTNTNDRVAAALVERHAVRAAQFVHRGSYLNLLDTLIRFGLFGAFQHPFPGPVRENKGFLGLGPLARGRE
jgi:hypothetical protein